MIDPEDLGFEVARGGGRTTSAPSSKHGSIKGQPCAYCGKPSVNGDHVIPRSMVKRYSGPPIPKSWLAVVPSCFACNMRKGNRRLVPPSWAKRLPAMNRFFAGARFVAWNGDPKSEAFRSVHR